jgi:hypothetical protein
MYSTLCRPNDPAGSLRADCALFLWDNYSHNREVLAMSGNLRAA